jgi:hypothetical protein
VHRLKREAGPRCPQGHYLGQPRLRAPSSWQIRLTRLRQLWITAASDGTLTMQQRSTTAVFDRQAALPWPAVCHKRAWGEREPGERGREDNASLQVSGAGDSGNPASLHNDSSLISWGDEGSRPQSMVGLGSQSSLVAAAGELQLAEEAQARALTSQPPASASALLRAAVAARVARSAQGSGGCGSGTKPRGMTGQPMCPRVTERGHTWSSGR